MRLKMRRARSSQSAVHCPASSLGAPSGADPGPSMDSVEEAGTTARLDHIIARLQTLEAADQAYLWLSTCAAVWSTAWLEIPPTQRTGRPVTVFHNGGLMPYVRFVDPVSPWWTAEFVSAGRPTRGTSIVPSCAGAMAAVSLVQFAPLQSHSWPQTRKRVGRVKRQVVQ